MARSPAVSRLAPILQGFFTDRLSRQRQASPHTIAAYRDSIRLLLAYAANATGKQPVDLDVTDLDAALIVAFLTHLETARGNSVTTRNARLAAIRSLFRYAALQAPEHAAVIAARAGHPAQTLRPGHRRLPDPRTRPPRCWPPPTGPPGSAGATTPCSPWPSRPDCASAS